MTTEPSTVMPRLVLASGSPRRVELLSGLGIEFDRRPVDLDESVHPGEPARDYVARLGHEKAAVISETDDRCVVLAADTVVTLDGDILGKPVDAGDARRMLERLSGRRHRVLTGVALHHAGSRVSHVEETAVEFRDLEEREIDWYLSTAEPWDKAGSYAMQGAGALFIRSIEGSATNVIGLPLQSVHELFGRLGLDLLAYCNVGSAPPSH